jgi:PAS domain S-box-containing protein
MGSREPRILCIFRDKTLTERLNCLQTQDANLAIEYLPWDDPVEVEKKIKESPFRFDVTLLEVPDINKIEQPEIEVIIKDYYRDIEIVYISISDDRFFVKPQQLLPGWRADQSLVCAEIFQLLCFLCRQVHSRRERQMLEGLHQLTLGINEKSVDLTDILKLTCRTAVEIMKVDHSGFVIFEKDLSRGWLNAEYPKIHGDELVEIPVDGMEREERLVFKKEHIDIQNLVEDKTLNEKFKAIFIKWRIRSVLIVPVVLNQKVIASFSLDMIKKCRHFYEDEIEFCRKLAAHIALAIGNARHLKEISVLNEIGMALEEQSIQTGDIKKIAESIRDKAAQLVDVKNFFLLSYDAKRDYYEFLFHQDEYDDVSAITPAAMRNSFSAYVIRQKRPQILRPKDIDELIGKGELNRVGHKSRVWLGAPLIARDRVIGLIVVQSYSHEEAYDEHDLTILSTIAGQAAIAIDNYHLYQDLRKQLLQVNALYGISQAIMQETPNISGLLEKIVREAVEFSRAQAGQFISYDSARNIFRVMFTFNLDELKGMGFTPDEGMISQVYKTGKGYFTNDYFRESYACTKLNEPKFRDKIQGMVQVPLKWEGNIIGILVMTSRPGDGRIFSQVDVEQLEQFAGPVTIAIRIARTISFQQALLQSSPEAIIALDNKGRITEFNRTSEQIMGYRKQDMLGQFVADYYYDGIEEARRMKKILDEGELTGKAVRDIHANVKGKNGERIPILFSGSILKDEFGLSIGSIGMVRDLREITKIEKEYHKQQSILAELESMPLDSSIKQRDGLQKHIKELLRRTCESCRLKYMILFASFSENETVLQPLAWWGLPAEIETRLPLFNWRKVGLLPGTGDAEADIRLEAEIITGWLPNEEWRKRIINGIKGQNKDYFQNFACGIPVRLADNFRSLLVFGPFIDQTDLMKMEKFLKNIALVINIRAMSWLQAIYLQARRKESENALHLITHRTRMYLQQITGKFGLIKQKVSKDSPGFEKAAEGEKLALHTARVIKHVLFNQSAEMEPEDYTFQPHSLAALVENCAATFEERAREMRREIRLDESIDNLPQAEVDDRFLSVAIGNLIENAIKYSYEETYIKIFSSYDLKTATITVQDIGERLDDRARENLLKPGKRWSMSARSRQIPGSGFGLWESSVIAVAHEGHVDFSSVTYKSILGKPAHQVKVWLTIPLKQEKKNVPWKRR